MTRQRAAGERGGGESRSGERDCLAPGASLFTAGTNLNAGLMKLSTDKRAQAQGWGGNGTQSTRAGSAAAEKEGRSKNCVRKEEKKGRFVAAKNNHTSRDTLADNGTG